MKRSSGFTLIELLIVVAIIAILAAIAVPNFLEAQVRAKVSRIKSDQRTLATAIESYAIDYNRPPLGQEELNATKTVSEGGPFPDAFSNWAVRTGFEWSQFTTPVAYMSSIPINVFGDKGKVNAKGVPNNQLEGMYYHYQAFTKEILPDGETSLSPSLLACNRIGASWFLGGQGPSRRDLPHGVSPPVQFNMPNGVSRTPTDATDIGYPDIFYDPTNGTVSYGALIRSSKGIEPAS